MGEEDGRVGQKDAVLLNDCCPLDSNAFGKFELEVGEIEGRGRHLLQRTRL